MDFILGRVEVAIEVKGSDRIDGRDLRPLKTFIAEYRPAKAYLVCNEASNRLHEAIHIVPWRHFLSMLWAGEVSSSGRGY